MPAEVSVAEPSKDRQADKMPSATPKAYGELQQNAPVFSYAQAAKGRSPSVPSALSISKSSSVSADMDGKRTSVLDTMDSTVEASKDSSKRTASEGRTPHGNDFKVAGGDRQAESVDPPVASKRATNDANKANSSAENTSPVTQPQASVSTPSSPEYGTTSTSTLPKEEDIFSTGNGSSDSTSDKQSSTSQSMNRPSEKLDGEKEEAVNASWDEEGQASVPVLKEAAPPPVNVWQMRSQAQAKTKAVVNPQPPKSANLMNGVVSNSSPSNSNETSTEPKKQDSRKKSKVIPGPTEDRSSTGVAKERPTDLPQKAGQGPIAPPPPSGDATSWPTPDRVVGDGRKRNQDRMEKSEKDTPQVTKPHGKEKWVPVPYVPTAVFVTPMPPPRRGGRGAPRGGRDGDARGRNTAVGGNAVEKPTTANEANEQHSPTTVQDRGRVALTSASTNANPAKSKRASSAGPSTMREQKKIGDPPGPEKGKDGETAAPKGAPTNSNTSNASRRPSASTVNRESQHITQPVNGYGTDHSWSSRNVEHNNGENKPQPDISQASAQPKTNGFERRGDGPMRHTDFSRDFQGGFPNRERGEHRGDRGRGGYRGRGGGSHAFFNQNMANGHGYSNGHVSQYQPSSASPSKPHSNHERLPSQSQGSTYQPPNHQPKHYRTNSRSQSIPHSAQYSRFSNGHHGGPPHLANLQTDLANEYGYLPANQGAMTAMPFSSYGEQPSVFGMVNLQMNYYFSVENLCKDMYLRSHMDSQGFVFLELLAQFNRIKQLTNDMELIRLACNHSHSIEYVNVDGIDRVRAREGWQQWVRKMEERDPSAQNDGPSLPPAPQYPHISDNHQATSPGTNIMGIPTDNIQYQSLNGFAPPFDPSSAMVEPSGVAVHATKTPLSAAVSEFSPSVHYTNQRKISTSDPHAQGTSVFTDSQVENLRILVRKPLNATAPIPPPFHSSSSRTFSNGSIDGRSINDELSKFAERQSRPTVNGDTPESGESSILNRSRSPFSVGSPTRQMDNNVSPPVLWIKDRQNSVDSLKSMPSECVHESYHDFRQDALKQREQSGLGKDHYNMQSLYQFWSHFLIRNFNASMYEEFHRLALEDATQRESSTGMKSLLRFYDESILSQKAVSDDKVAMDFVQLVKTESSGSERPVFAKLRAAWRNGAFNMRNRSKLTKFVDADLKAGLER